MASLQEKTLSNILALKIRTKKPKYYVHSSSTVSILTNRVFILVLAAFYLSLEIKWYVYYSPSKFGRLSYCYQNGKQRQRFRMYEKNNDSKLDQKEIEHIIFGINELTGHKEVNSSNEPKKVAENMLSRYDKVKN